MCRKDDLGGFLGDDYCDPLDRWRLTETVAETSLPVKGRSVIVTCADIETSEDVAIVVPGEIFIDDCPSKGTITPFGPLMRTKSSRLFPQPVVASAINETLTINSRELMIAYRQTPANF